ncbi:MAG TPA: DUF1656 domain-containing protein [Candidatus Methylacidiphilales bacterium]
MKEWNIGGVFLAPLAGYLAVTVALYFGTRSFFLRDIERRVWHPSLVKVCLFLVLLALVSFLF